MPGFNVADLIENNLSRSSTNRMDDQNHEIRPEELVKDTIHKQNILSPKLNTTSVHHRQQHGYDNLVSLIQNVLQQQSQNHKHQSQHPQQEQQQQHQSLSSQISDLIMSTPKVISRPNGGPLDNKTVLAATVTPCVEKNCATEIQFDTVPVPPVLAEFTSDPGAWQRLFYLYPELADYLVKSNYAYGNRLDHCPDSTASNQEAVTPSGKHHKLPGEMDEQTMDLSNYMINSQMQTSPGNGATHRTATTTGPEYASWWDASGMSEILGIPTHRTSLYMDPRNMTINYCNSILEAGGKSTLFFPPDLRKPKRIRTAFSPAQLFQLENTFERNHYVVGQERKDLAAGLGLTETQVKVWFQNRRTKYKRMRMEDPDQSSSTCGAEPDSPYIPGSGNHSEEGLDLSNDPMTSRAMADTSGLSASNHEPSGALVNVTQPEDLTERVDLSQEALQLCKSRFDLDRLFPYRPTTGAGMEQECHIELCRLVLLIREPVMDIKTNSHIHILFSNSRSMRHKVTPGSDGKCTKPKEDMDSVRTFSLLEAEGRVR
ncbi:unnamed protein product [Echinostoma caproni]|uniref:Homeobox domain-containing protein n=1 Tax=Echinostoma caproni TaxID=27848 RepID=A0A183ABA2_9TREM|nr:unnamed protein product [Echinostoma caproni]